MWQTCKYFAKELECKTYEGWSITAGADWVTTQEVLLIMFIATARSAADYIHLLQPLYMYNTLVA